MAGRIKRIHRNLSELPDGSPNPDYQPDRPLLWPEYLLADDDRGIQWTDEAALAMEFPSHGLAEEYAAKLMADHPEVGHIHATSYHHDDNPRPDEPPPGYRPRNSFTRRERIREELRQEDLRAIDESYLE